MALLAGSNLMRILFLVFCGIYLFISEKRKQRLGWRYSHTVCCLKRVTFQKKPYCLLRNASYSAILTSREWGFLHRNATKNKEIASKTLQNVPFENFSAYIQSSYLILLYLLKAFKSCRLVNPVFGRLDIKLLKNLLRNQSALDLRMIRMSQICQLFHSKQSYWLFSQISIIA